MIGRASREKLQNVVDRYGLWAIVLARLAPVLSTDAASYAAGLVCMRFSPSSWRRFWERCLF